MLTFSLNDRSNTKMERFISVYTELADQYGADAANNFLISNMVEANILRGNEFINLKFDERNQYRYGKMDFGVDISETDGSRFNVAPVDVYADLEDDLLIAHIRADLFSDDSIRYCYGYFGINIIKSLCNPFYKSNRSEGSVSALRSKVITGQEAILQLLAIKGYDISEINLDKFVAMLISVREEFYPASY
jgi:hypothetical protein